MSSCIRGLYVYDSVKKCSNCGSISMKSNLHKEKAKNNGYGSECITCKKIYNYDKREKRNLYFKNKIKTEVNFRLIYITRRRIHHALIGKSKSCSTLDILGIDNETYRKWIQWQFIPEINWTNIEIDNVKTICMFDVSKDEELKEALSWKYTQPLLKQHHQQKGTKFDFLDHQLQFIRAYQFLKINEEDRLNENIQ